MKYQRPLYHHTLNKNLKINIYFGLELDYVSSENLNTFLNFVKSLMNCHNIMNIENNRKSYKTVYIHVRRKEN